MIGRLRRIRLNAAEAALTEGRLDEAFRLASTPDLAGERRAQRVFAAAGNALFDRAEEHFKHDRFSEALIDLDKAERAGVKPQRVGDLRAIVQAACTDRERKHADRRERLEAAEDRLARGSLRAAEKILEGAGPHDLEAQKMQNKAASRERRAQELFDEVQQYVKEGQLSVAVSRFKEACRLHPKDRQAAKWAQVLVDQIVESARRALNEGRVNRAFEEMRVLSGVGDDRPAKREALSILDRIADARQAIDAADYEQARRFVLSLQHLLPKARWVGQASKQLKDLDELATEVAGGPLGLAPLATPGLRRAIAPAGMAKPGLAETMPACSDPQDSSELPERLLVLVDGAGSYLVIRRSRASIGRAACPQPADIALVSDISQRHADLARVEDDYFLFANREVNVGGQNVRQKLLQNGDKIMLGKRAKLSFNLPSRKSTTAVLDLSDSAKMANDVRRVILFDRFATIGRSSNCHIVTLTAGEDLVLYERGGKLWIRHRANGKGDEGSLITLGESFEFAGVSMVIEPWAVRA